MATWICRTLPRSIDPTDAYTRRYDWRYDGNRFEWPLALPRVYYETHRRRHRVYTYGTYVADAVTQRVVAGLCASLERKAADRDFSRSELLRFASAFVQHLPYTPDNVSTEYSNYPRYPIETLVDETGDCEDSSLLLASILHGLGFAVGLVEFPTHLGVGVSGTDFPSNITFDGVEYTYLEATGTGWEPGMVPPDYQGVPTSLHRVEDAPALYSGWRADIDGDEIACAGTVVNYGAGPAADVRFRLGFAAPGNQFGRETHQQFGELSVGEERTWRARIACPEEAALQPTWTLAIDGIVHDEGQGEPINPRAIT